MWKASPGINKAKTRVNKKLKSLNLSRDPKILPLNYLTIYVLNPSADRTEGARIFQRSKFYRLTHPNLDVSPGINKAQTRVNKTLTSQNLFRNFDISLFYWFIVYVVDVSFDFTEGTRFRKRPKLHGLTHPN